jgi:ActR/RegA family two-component response regulator
VPRASPEIVLLGADWHPRALIRAQLIEEGFDVVATDSFSMMRSHLRPGSKPRLAIVDLKGLPDPADVLSGLRSLMQPSRVLVLTGSGTVRPAEIERLGFRTLSRPLVIRDVVDAAVEAIRARDSGVGGVTVIGGGA